MMKRIVTILCALSMLCACAGNEKGDVAMIENGKTVLMDYTLTVEGAVADTSDGREPLKFVQGDGNIIKGLERELLGMAVGESKTVVVAPEDGYGMVKPEALQEIPKEQMPEGVDIKVGMMLQAQTPNGGILPLLITEIRESTVVVDFNHPLAGKELTFDVTIVDVQ